MGQKVLRRWSLKAMLGDATGTVEYGRIALAIMRDIERGRLKPGAILPNSRELAVSLQVNRSVNRH